MKPAADGVDHQAHLTSGSLIEASGIEVRYERGGTVVQALAGVSLEIPRGEFLCVMGPSGSGKSTLLHTLSGLQAPSAGSVLVDGVDLHRLSDDEATRYRRRHLGLIFQFFNLVPTLDVERNAALPLLADGARMSQVRDRVGAVLERLGIAHRRHHAVSELSGGEMQRVAIARAILPGPDWICADEPTGSLDSRTGREILELLRHACDKDGITTVLMTHDPTALSFADRLVEIRDGRVWRDVADPETADLD